jgi:hypothetical protein
MFGMVVCLSSALRSSLATAAYRGIKLFSSELEALKTANRPRSFHALLEAKMAQKAHGNCVV